MGHYVVYYLRSHGRNLRNIVIVGEGKDATPWLTASRKKLPWGYRVVRVINAEEA